MSFSNWLSSAISFVSNIIDSIISWWNEVYYIIETITEIFIKSKRSIIESADDPERLTTITAAKKEASELEKKANELEKTLSSSYKDKLREMELDI